MIVALLAIAGIASSQSWISEYDRGLDAAKKGDWTTARAAFQQAIAYRTEDTDKPTNLPGPVTEVRRWRNGAPYSPNFLAAYSAYRLGMTLKDQERATSLNQAAGEFEILLDKGQNSREAFYFLNAIYTTLGDTAKRQALESRFAKIDGKAGWKVDTEVVSPEEMALINNIAGPRTNTPTVIKPNEPIKIPSNANPGTTPLNPIVGPVAPIATKYALIIGNTETKMSDLAVPFASDDAQKLREALVANAGYPEQNIDLVINGTAEQIMKSAEALAQRVDENATVLIYFSGVGINIGGKDFLAGVDTESIMDTGSMAAKGALFKLFLTKGAKVFSFFQTNRPITNGRYFGQEVPMVGQLSQMQACIPGGVAYSYMQSGKEMGLFSNAMIRVLAQQRSNQVPILEFGWQVFNKMRRGDTGTSGGSSRQTCTLPVLTNIASDARF
jgi:hypothetical protein